jgi:hypothetical protein
MADHNTLRLVREQKISELLPDPSAGRRYEASGVLAMNGQYFVVFDNRSSVARLSEDLESNHENGLLGAANIDRGYEGICYNSNKSRFYLLVESRKFSGSKYYAEIVEFDISLSYIKRRRVDFPFDSDNKGFEAICYVRRDKRDYVLALCEGNKCQSGRQGRKPGGGRIQVFEKKKNRWSRVATIKLPKSVQFQDYSGMALANGRVAVVSQQNSQLWIAAFDEATWSWRDDGQTYRFPLTTDGEIKYGTIEGVSWLTNHSIVTVSDRRKKGQPDHISETDQSIHVFDW